MCAADADDTARAVRAALAGATGMPARSAARWIGLRVHAATERRTMRKALHAQSILTATSRSLTWRTARACACARASASE